MLIKCLLALVIRDITIPTPVYLYFKIENISAHWKMCIYSRINFTK